MCRMIGPLVASTGNDDRMAHMARADALMKQFHSAVEMDGEKTTGSFPSTFRPT